MSANKNLRTPKRARPADDDSCSSSHSTLTKPRPRRDSDDDGYASGSSSRQSKSSQKAKPATINAVIKYECCSTDAVNAKLRELFCLFSEEKIPHVKTGFHKGSFVVDPASNDLHLLVHLRRSVPFTKWDKIRSRTGGVEVVMKPADPWCIFYDFVADRLPFTQSSQMADNEEVFLNFGQDQPCNFYQFVPPREDARSSFADQDGTSRSLFIPSFYGQDSASSSCYHDQDSNSRASLASSSYYHGQDSNSRASLASSSYYHGQDSNSRAQHDQDSTSQAQHDQDSISQAQHDQYSTSQAQHDQGELGLLDLARIADVIDPAPRPTDVLSHSDLELCRSFLSSDLPLPASSLDDVATVVRTFFSSLPNEHGRYALGLMWLPQWETLSNTLCLEHMVLDALNSSYGMPPVPNVAALDVSLLPADFSMREAIGSLMAQRLGAFQFRVQLVDRTSMLYLLVVHMFHELFNPSSPLDSPPLAHFTRNLIQDTNKLVLWRRSLCEFARSIQSVDISSFLAHELQLPPVWTSHKPSSSNASGHHTSIVQQNMKIKSKVKNVAERLDLAIDKGFASTVFWRMQENTKLTAALTVDSPLFRMLPHPSFSAAPASHMEDIQTLLDSLQFPLAALPVFGP